MMERWAVQLPLTHGCSPRSTRWPALQQWYEAMEAMPAYSQTVKGDAYSWASLVGTFQRMFANANATANGTATAAELAAAAEREAKSKAAILASDRAAAAELKRVRETSLDERPREARVAAARALISNRAAVLADTTSTEPKTQTNLRRADEEDERIVDAVLRETARRLLAVPADDTYGLDGSGYADQPGDAVAAAAAARYVARRVCVPRDMGEPAAEALRGVLLEVAAECESYAWSASGGLL